MNCNSCFPAKKSKEILERIHAMQEGLQKKGYDALLVEDEVDLYYLTGLELSAGQLLLAKSEALLLVDGRYIEVAEGVGFIEAKLMTKEEVIGFFKRNKVKKCAFDGKKLSYGRVEDLKKYGVELVSWDFATKDVRVIKSEEEIALLRASADLLWEGFLYIQSILKEGITEKQVRMLFNVFCLEKGAEGLSFDPIIAFGEGSAMPHYKVSERKLKKGDVVLIDIGVVLNHYPSDMTRVLFFGEGDPLMQKWLELTKRAHRAALDLAKPGVCVGELDAAARKVYKEHDVEEYFVHSLGHGVGLEVHEFPRIKFDGVDAKTTLEEGMVFTVEPGLYMPGKGGVRYEDTVVITKEGYLNFFEENKDFNV
jgi:Xaa-Pro aminopeptidase